MDNSPGILSRQDRELVPIFTVGRAAVERVKMSTHVCGAQFECNNYIVSFSCVISIGQVRQQGEYESIHRDFNIGFSTWEFDPTEIENPFPENEGSVHIWMGDEDMYVPVTLQRYIA
ncbi:hypothetical protein L1987_84387 [Smallanthus sonchifolius]|uniref:Uncharacterized protein n=1 Tax=Smallanthus sonchifolius TaxID=185202 RepID=A0ACB8YF84_9ASTR|nr:hypothetical protein L1987_84387 [Smallanthus sonchifolius]